MEKDGFLRRFLFPKINRLFLIRVALLIFVSVVVFSFVLVPVRLRGKSMEPTLRDGSLHFIFALSYLFSEPAAGDVVGIELAGRRVILLKRVVAVGGERVAFENGVLMINGKPRPEPYMKTDCDWNYDERVVKEANLFVVGDNRAVPIERHDFGEVPKRRITGKLIW